MTERSLRADCTRCCGLCCVGPAFLRIQGFAYNKPARSPCINLQSDDRCTIYPARQQLGFPACQGFDCFGSGQWVTQQLYGGRSWRDSTQETAGAMFEAYARFRVLHELLAMTDLVGRRVALTADALGNLKTLLLQACAHEQQKPKEQDLNSLRRFIQGELRRIVRRA
jgi:hypothetical protein